MISFLIIRERLSAPLSLKEQALPPHHHDYVQSPFLTMLCRRRRHLDGGNGKDVVRAITDGVRRVREMTRQVKRFDAQAHRHSCKIVGAIAASGRTATAPTARKEGEHMQGQSIRA